MDQKFLTPEDFETIMAASNAPEQQKALEAQMAMAQRMRTPMPEMRNAGRVNVAPNPLEFLAQGLNNVRANKSERSLMEAQKALVEELRKSRSAFGRNAMMNSGQPMPQPAPPPMGVPDPQEANRMTM